MTPSATRFRKALDVAPLLSVPNPGHIVLADAVAFGKHCEAFTGCLDRPSFGLGENGVIAAPHVLGVRHRFQMVRVTARRVAAQVIDVVSGGNRTIAAFICGAMDIGFSTVNPCPAIAKRRTRSLPFVTSSFGVHSYAFGGLASVMADEVTSEGATFHFNQTVRGCATTALTKTIRNSIVGVHSTVLSSGVTTPAVRAARGYSLLQLYSIGGAH